MRDLGCDPGASGHENQIRIDLGSDVFLGTLVFYEAQNGVLVPPQIALDWIAITVGKAINGTDISRSTVVFWWGDVSVANNGSIYPSHYPPPLHAELNNETIYMSELYQSLGGGPQTGILIPVNGSYRYIWLVATYAPGCEAAQIDAIEFLSGIVTLTPTPTVTPTPTFTLTP